MERAGDEAVAAFPALDVSSAAEEEAAVPPAADVSCIVPRVAPARATGGARASRGSGRGSEEAFDSDAAAGSLLRDRAGRAASKRARGEAGLPRSEVGASAAPASGGTTPSAAGAPRRSLAATDALAPYELTQSEHYPQCTSCGRRDGGKLMLCDGCPRAFHRGCTTSQQGRVSQGFSWLCPICVAAGASFNTGRDGRSRRALSKGAKATPVDKTLGAAAHPTGFDEFPEGGPLSHAVHSASVPLEGIRASVSAARAAVLSAWSHAGLDGAASVIVTAAGAADSGGASDGRQSKLRQQTLLAGLPPGVPVIFHLALEPPLLPRRLGEPGAEPASSLGGCAGDAGADGLQQDSAPPLKYFTHSMPRALVSDRLWLEQLLRALDGGGCADHSTLAVQGGVGPGASQWVALLTASSTAAPHGPLGWVLNRVLSCPDAAATLLAPQRGGTVAARGIRAGKRTIGADEAKEQLAAPPTAAAATLLELASGASTDATAVPAGSWLGGPSIQLSVPLATIPLPSSSSGAGGRWGELLSADLPTSMPPALRVACCLPQVSEDGNEEACIVCGVGGDIVCCDMCSGSYHEVCEQELRAHGVPESDVCCGMCHLRLRTACFLSQALEDAAAAIAAAASNGLGLDASSSAPLSFGHVLLLATRALAPSLLKVALARTAWVAATTVDESGMRLCGPLVYLPNKVGCCG